MTILYKVTWDDGFDVCNQLVGVFSSEEKAKEVKARQEAKVKKEKKIRDKANAIYSEIIYPNGRVVQFSPKEFEVALKKVEEQLEVNKLPPLITANSTFHKNFTIQEIEVDKEYDV